jgi:putative protease
MKIRSRLELVCPAGTPASLRTAISSGADVVYCGFRDETNARNFPGLNFSRQEMEESVTFAHAHETRVAVAINTYPQAGREHIWRQAIDDAASFGADSILLADIGLLAYAAERHPGLRRHLSVQAAAANADVIVFYCRNFGVRRVVLPRILTVPEIAAINAQIECETEVFIFGGLCVMAEGRCSLSSYVTGRSPNRDGVCSPASHVVYRQDGENMVSMLGSFDIDRAGPGVAAPYPTLCKGSFAGKDFEGHVFEDPASLDATALIESLAAAGVTALKIEGRQRSRAYVGQVIRNIRRVVDNYAVGLPIPAPALQSLSEGQATTEGAYQKKWR